MKKIFVFFVLTIFVQHVLGQTLRIVKPLEPKRVAIDTLDGRFSVLIQKKYTNATKYYFVSSDSAGNVKGMAYRYGDISNSDTLTRPLNAANWVAYTNQTEPPVEPPTTLAYGFPDLTIGVVKYNASKQIVASYLKLDVFESGGVVYLRDLAYNSDFYYDDCGDYCGNSHEKRYYIGASSGTDNYYTASEMQAGINVNAYKGYEINVIVGYVLTSNTKYTVTWKEQQVYIPSRSNTETFSGGTYYNYYPNRQFNTDYVHDFTEYVTAASLAVPSTHYLSLNTYNEAERTSGTAYQSSGIFSKYATNTNYQQKYVGDDWLLNIGHPPAYTGTQTQWDAWYAGLLSTYGNETAAKNYIKGVFNTQVINQFKNYKFVILNNELKYYWNTTFQSWIKECYQEWKSATANTLAGFGNRLFTFDLYAPNKSLAYSDWTSAENYATFATNAASHFVKATPTTDYKYELGNNGLGQYYNLPNFSGDIYYRIIGALFAQKFSLPHKNIGETWRTVESYTSTGRQGKFYQIYNNRAIEGFAKMTVSPHLLRNIGITDSFFGNGWYCWDDGFSVAETATAFYPNGSNVVYLDNREVVNGSGDPKKTNVPTNNIDALIDGSWAVYQNALMLSAPIQIADVNEASTWRTGADAFVVGAWVDAKPFVAYRRVNNNYLVYAYERDNKYVKEIQIRMKDSNNADVIKTIRLNADNVSIIKF